MKLPQVALLAGAATAVLSLSACGLGAGEKSTAVSLTVTKDFGTVRVAPNVTAEPPASETAMRQLQRAYKVETSYAGRFVKGIRGLNGGTADGRPVDWFYFVNGIEAPVGAADTVLHGGDAVWWDFRDWGAATHVPAVVGAWPHPFTGAVDGKRPAVRVLCAPGADAACALVERRLADEGVPAARGLAGSAGKGSGLRVLVGDWEAIRPDPAAALIEEGPASSGVYLKPRFNSGGASISILNPTGRVTKTLTGSVSMIAATALGEGLPTWVVSGTDEEAVVRAAGRLTSKDLGLRYSVVWLDGVAFPAPAVDGS